MSSKKLGEELREVTSKAYDRSYEKWLEDNKCLIEKWTQNMYRCAEDAQTSYYVREIISDKTDEWREQLFFWCEVQEIEVNLAQIDVSDDGTVTYDLTFLW